MEDQALTWADGGVARDVRPLERFAVDGAEYVVGALPAAPSFPFLFRVEEGQRLVRLDPDAAALVQATRAARLFEEEAVTSASGRRLVPIGEAELDEGRYALLLDVDRPGLVVGRLVPSADPDGGEEVVPVEDAVAARAVEAAVFLSQVPEPLVEYLLLSRAGGPVQRAQAHLMKLGRAVADLGKAGARGSDEYRAAQAAYDELAAQLRGLEEDLV